jgi:sugar phosphate isomerase/epimerase
MAWRVRKVRGMTRLGLECLSSFGLHPAEFVNVTRELGCDYVTLNLGRAANRLPGYADYCIRDDSKLQREVERALGDHRVTLGMLEGFSILPTTDPASFEKDLDIAARLGARAICAVSMDRELPRTFDLFAQLTDLAAARGIVTTTEVGAGVLGRLPKALAAIAAVDHPSFRLLIDTMHFFRLGASVADLAELKDGTIGHVQLCDVPMPAVMESYMEEALYERRAPGDGDLPLTSFLRSVPHDVVVGLEIPTRSEAEAGIAISERLGRCVMQARRILVEAGDPPSAIS